jgi:nucleoside-diphosphate-sugar epimerase
MSSLFVIGGTGFFGKSFIDAFNRGLLDNWNIKSLIICAKHIDTFKEKYHFLLNNKIKFLSLDINTANELPHADYVIHAASSTNLMDYINNPQKEKENIINGATNFCRLSSKIYHNSKVLFVSSGAVYGVQDNVGPDENAPFNSLELLTNGKNTYAFSKQLAEKEIMSMSKHVKSSIARCYSFVGSFLPRDQHFAVGNFIDNVVNRRPINVKATKKVYRSYMHVDDLIHWLMTILEHSSHDCSIYNVGSDDVIEINELANRLGEEYDLDVIYEHDHPVGEDFYVPDISKAKDNLNLDISYNSYDSITHIITNITKNLDK